MTETGSALSGLKGKTVVVLGAGRGIGKSVAHDLCKRGVNVVLAARTATQLEVAAREIKLDKAVPESLRVLSKSADVTNTNDLKGLFDFAKKELGGIDGLVCASGIYGEFGKFADLDFSAWLKAIEINLIGTARAVHLALPYLRKSEDGARIVLFSGGGQGPQPFISSYVTSKGGVWRFTETVAEELADRGVYLNAIAPGAVNTQLLDEILEAGAERVGARLYEQSLKQKQTGGTPPDKAALLCAYLLSGQSKGLFGKTISAVWDPFLEFSDMGKLSKSDIFQFKRIVDFEGRTRT